MEQLSIIGNLGSDAVCQNYQGGSFVSFRVACTRKFKQGAETREVTTWYSCAYNNVDSGVIQFLTKGTKVFCQGYPSYVLYDSQKYRQKMIDVQLSVTRIELCGQANVHDSSDIDSQEHVDDDLSDVNAF